MALPVIQVIYLHRFARIPDDPLQLALLVLQQPLAYIGVVPWQYLYHFTIFQLAYTGREAILTGTGKVQCTAALAAIVVIFPYRRVAVYFLHLTGGSIEKVKFFFRVLQNSVVHIAVLLARQRTGADDALDEPFITHAAYRLRLIRQIDITHLVRGTVPPVNAPPAVIVHLIQRGVIVPCGEKESLYGNPFHIAGGSIHDIAAFRGVVRVRILNQIHLYRIIPGGHAIIQAALQLDFRQLFLCGSGAVRFYNIKSVCVGGFVIFLVHAVQPGVGIHHIIRRCAAQSARSGRRRGGNFQGGLGGLGRFGERYAGGVRSLRPAGGKRQRQGQQAGEDSFHRCSPFVFGLAEEYPTVVTELFQFCPFSGQIATFSFGLYAV